MDLDPSDNPGRGALPIEKGPVTCPVCCSDRCSVWCEPTNPSVTDPARLYGAASGVAGTQRLVTCLGCGMIYENPRFAEAVILQGYAASQEAGHDSQYPLRVLSFHKALQRLRSSLPAPGARVLDIGTAGGAFLEAATRFGFQATGLEPSRFLVEQGQARGLDVHQGTLDRHPLEGRVFDMVCLWDVIEHVVDPALALARIRSLLAPNGVLLVNFPDIGTPIARLAGRRYWWVHSSHLHHFTRDTLRRLCGEAGYTPYRIAPYYQTLQLGHLVDMAVQLGMPLSGLARRFLPGFLARIPIPYYASQTTLLARLRPE